MQAALPVACLVLAALACRSPVPPPAASRPAARAEAPAGFRLAVPRALGPVTFDGELDEDDWRGLGGRTGAFVEAVGGAPAIPHSEARFGWDEAGLRVALYAGDEDLRACGDDQGPEPGDDVFRLRLRTDAAVVDLAFSPSGRAWGTVRRAGTTAAWRPEALGVDVDGTLNQTGDEDEEWVIETRIPWEILGIRAGSGVVVGAAIDRCDTPLFATTRCGAWGVDLAGNLVGVLETVDCPASGAPRTPAGP